MLLTFCVGISVYQHTSRYIRISVYQSVYQYISISLHCTLVEWIKWHRERMTGQCLFCSICICNVIVRCICTCICNVFMYRCICISLHCTLVECSLKWHRERMTVQCGQGGSKESAFDTTRVSPHFAPLSFLLYKYKNIKIKLYKYKNTSKESGFDTTTVSPHFAQSFLLCLL